jgi:hypothetical protein
MDAGLGCWTAHHTNGLARALAGARVGLSALASDGQPAQMAHATIALDALETFQIHSDLAAKIALDHVFAVLDGMNDQGELLLGEVFGADGRVNLRVGEDDFGVAWTNAIDVTQSNIDALVRGNFYSDNAGHLLVR